MAGNPPEDRSHNRGMIMPGDAYTGAAVTYRHPDTGHQKVVFAGSMAGQWHGEHDPAHGLAAGLSSSGDGYRPHRIEFTMPHEEGRLPGTKYHPLMPADMDSIRVREYNKNKERKQ